MNRTIVCVWYSCEHLSDLCQALCLGDSLSGFARCSAKSKDLQNGHIVLHIDGVVQPKINSSRHLFCSRPRRTHVFELNCYTPYATLTLGLFSIRCQWKLLTRKFIQLVCRLRSSRTSLMFN